MEVEKSSFRNAQYTAMADVTTCVCARLQESGWKNQLSAALTKGSSDDEPAYCLY